VGPIAIHYWASLRPCLGTAIAPRRRARFRQTLLRRLEPVEERPEAGARHGELRLEELLEGSCVLESPGVERLVARVSDQLRGRLLGLVVAAVEAPGRDLLPLHPVVDPGEDGVERLGDVRAGALLDVGGERLGATGAL